MAGYGATAAVAILTAMLSVALPSVTAAAELAVSGDYWADYWAQQQAGNARQQVSDGAGWLPGPQGDVTAAPKTFLSGIELSLAGTLTDELSAAVELSSDGAGVAMDQAFARLALPGSVTVTAGLCDMPFGREYIGSGDGADDDAVFINDFSQRDNAVLRGTTDLGLVLSGATDDALLTWSLALFNGSLCSVADSAGVTGAAAIDNNDAKSVAGQLLVRPRSNVYLLGSYAAGDYPNPFTGRAARYAAAGIGAGVVLFDQLNFNGEWAAVRHEKMMYDFGMGTGEPRGELVAARVNEFSITAAYTGPSDWNCGVRYGVVDPHNIEAEVDAGFARETQTSVGVRYRFAENAELYVELSHIETDLSHYDKYDAARLGAGATRLESNDPDDDILDIELIAYY